MADDYYQVLGLSRGASADEIHKAHKRLARKYHPDLHEDDDPRDKKRAKEQFQKVQQAYDVLSDPEKRNMYDQFGPEFERMGGGGSPFGGGGGGGNPFGGGGGADSCEGRCGNYNAGLSCQCDDQCTTYGDCCDDKAAVCDAPPPGPQPGPDSCVDECGGKSGSCWCDSQCDDYGDCCDNKVAVCG